MNQLLTLKKMAQQNPLVTGVVVLSSILFIVIRAWDIYAPIDVSGWNGKAVPAIRTKDPEDFTFAVFGDNKNGYTLFDALMRDIDQRNNASFAIALGDLVPGGEKRNFRHFIGEIKDDLNIPLITVIGNHDLQDDSDETYRAIFGPTNYRFAIGKNEFIVLNAPTQNGVSQKDREWLSAALENAQSAEARFVFMHVSPFDPRGGQFHKCLKDGADLMTIFQRYHVTHLFAGHIHGYFSGVWKGVPYTISGGGGGELNGQADQAHFFYHYVEARVHHGMVDIDAKPVSAGIGLRQLDIMEDHWLEWASLFPAVIALFCHAATYRRSRQYCRDDRKERQLDRH